MLGAKDLIVFAGGEGVTLEQHGELMQAAANLLIITGHAGRANNGLIPVWPGANMQGAYDMGFSAEATQALLNHPPKMWIIAGANPVEEDSRAAEAIEPVRRMRSSRPSNRASSGCTGAMPKVQLQASDSPFMSFIDIFVSPTILPIVMDD